MFAPSEKPKSSKKPEALAARPRPTQLLVYYHPHPLKRHNKAHIDSLMNSLVPGSPPVETNLHIRARKPWRPWTFKAPFTAETRFHSSTFTAGGKVKMQTDYWHVAANFDALVDGYVRKGYVRAVVRDDTGKDVDCDIVLTRAGDAVPKGAFKEIRVWREPLLWLGMKIREWEEEKAKRKAMEKEEQKKKKKKEEEEKEDEKVDGDVDDLEWMSIFDEDEKKAMSWV